MRVIILDTETTGLSPKYGHRIIEIGCIEMESLRLTGRHFHTYINPERDVPAKSTEITGLTEQFLKDHPPFHHIVDSFLEFIADSPLIIHNAAFDMSFLNAELNMANRPLIDAKRAIDTLFMARKQFPGSPASLDALCKRFDVSLNKRDKHGALIDAELLSHVYVELMGGRQKTLSDSFFDKKKDESQQVTMQDNIIPVTDFPIREFKISDAEGQHHHTFIKTLKNPLWNEFINKKQD